MKALVVFESMFGNTEQIAQAVAEGLRASMPVDVAEVIDAPADPPEDVTLIVAGGPTEAFLHESVEHARRRGRSRWSAGPAGRRPAGMDGGAAAHAIRTPDWSRSTPRSTRCATFLGWRPKARPKPAGAMASTWLHRRRAFSSAIPPARCSKANWTGRGHGDSGWGICPDPLRITQPATLDVIERALSPAEQSPLPLQPPHWPSAGASPQPSHFWPVPRRVRLGRSRTPSVMHDRCGECSRWSPFPARWIPGHAKPERDLLR